MSANTKFIVSQQQDLVVVKEDRSYGGPPELVVLKVDGNTGAVSFPTTALQDTWDKPAADGAAATATAEHSFLRAASKLTVKAVRYVPDAALTADNTNFATITVRVRNSDGTNALTVAAVTTAITGSGNWAQWVAVNLPLTNVSLTAGQILTVQIAKAGSGVVIPAGALVVDYVLAA
jgi:hypothetical protein